MVRGVDFSASYIIYCRKKGSEARERRESGNFRITDEDWPSYPEWHFEHGVIPHLFETWNHNYNLICICSGLQFLYKKEIKELFRLMYDHLDRDGAVKENTTEE